MSTNLDNYSILIELWLIARDVTHAKELTSVRNELRALIINRSDGVIGDGRVTHALEELNAFFSLKILKVAVFFDEVLLLSRELLIL